MGEPSLYERLGGVYAISAVVDHFSDQLVEKGTIEEQNQNIKDWNENKAASRLPGLKVCGHFGCVRSPEGRSSTRA